MGEWEQGNGAQLRAPPENRGGVHVRCLASKSLQAAGAASDGCTERTERLGSPPPRWHIRAPPASIHPTQRGAGAWGLWAPPVGKREAAVPPPWGGSMPRGFEASSGCHGGAGYLQGLPGTGSAPRVPPTAQTLQQGSFAVLLSCGGDTGHEIRAEGGNQYMEESRSVPGTGSSPWSRHAMPRGLAAALAQVSPRPCPLGCCPARPLPQRDSVSPLPGAVPELPGPAARKPVGAFPCPAGRLQPG